jgi:EpsI family protein
MQPTRRNYWISVAILVMAVPLPSYLTGSRKIELRRPLDDLSFEIGNWRGRDEYLSDAVRRALGTNDILLRQYVDGEGHAVGLYVSYFPRQQHGESSHSPKHCLPGAGWQPFEARRVRYPLATDGSQMINEMLYEKQGQRQLVFYWFRERERIIASEYTAKWYLIWDAISRHRTDGALFRISAPVLDSEEATRERCFDFMRVALPELGQFLPD